MPQSEVFRFSDKHIKDYEENHYLENDRDYLLGNIKEENMDVIIENMDEDYSVNWDNICEKNELDYKFIHKYFMKMKMEDLINYQKLTKIFIENNFEKIKEEKLVELLIINQKNTNVNIK